jgi:translation initiation factor IF-1
MEGYRSGTLGPLPERIEDVPTRWLRCPALPRVLLSAALARDDLIQIKGTIVEALAGGNYRVKGDNGMEFLAKIGGRMRRYHIRVIPGDRVTIAVSPYDPSHGLIVFRG